MSKINHLSGQSKAIFFPLVIVFFEVVLYFSNDVFLPAIPQMLRDLHLTIPEAQLTVSLWFIGAAMTTLFVGMLSDHYGRRPLIVLGALLFSVASFFLMIVSNKYWFLFFRFMQGAMVSFLTVPGYAAIHESFDNKEALKMLALMSSITIIAPALGPLLGGIILHIAAWRYIFVMLFVLGLLSIVLLSFYAHETLAPEKRQTLALKSSCLSYYRLLKEPLFVLYNLLFSLLFSGFIAWITLSPLLLLQRFSFSTIQFGLVQVIIFASYIAGSKLINKLIDRYSKQDMITIALMITVSTSMLGLLLSFYQSTQILYFILSMMGYSFGAALCFPVLGRLAIEASEEPMGRRTGLQSAIMMFFASIGTTTAGWLYNGEIMGLSRFIAAIAFFTFCVHCGLLLKKRMLVSHDPA